MKIAEKPINRDRLHLVELLIDQKRGLPVDRQIRDLKKKIISNLKTKIYHEKN